jgi:uncharacterized protein YcfJ
MRLVSFAAVGCVLGFVSAVVAQEPAAPQPAAPPASAPACPPGYDCAATPSPAGALGLIVFPAKQQTPEVQLGEEQQCYAWAHQNTGIDPALVKSNPDSAAKVAKAKMDSATTGAAVGGAARGAAAGALIGGVTGNAGTGAGVGAVTGALAGRRAKKQASAKAAQAGAAAANAQAAEMINTFKKAMTACLEGKGYTVK